MSAIDLKTAAELLEKGHVDEAESALAELIRLVPQYVAAHVLLARIKESGNKKDEALEHWRTAFSLLPTSSVIEKGLRRSVLENLPDDGTSEPADAELNLELLIQELETARIVPDPNVEEISDDELEDEIEDLVSETLARIYAAQKYYREARQVYQKLARLNPERAHEFETKAIEMQKLAQESD